MSGLGDVLRQTAEVLRRYNEAMDAMEAMREGGTVHDRTDNQRTGTTGFGGGFTWNTANNSYYSAPDWAAHAEQQREERKLKAVQQLRRIRALAARKEPRMADVSLPELAETVEAYMGLRGGRRRNNAMTAAGLAACLDVLRAGPERKAPPGERVEVVG